jgi:hypothetical protein
MDEDEMPILRLLHIKLDEVHTERDRVLNRRERIFRRMPGGPTMADSQHPAHEVSWHQRRRRPPR